MQDSRTLLSLARDLQSAVPPTFARSPQVDWLAAFDALVEHPEVRFASRSLFEDAHYSRAVEEAYKALVSGVREKSGLRALDGRPLMENAFSLNAPRLKVNGLRTQTDRDQQLGYMSLFAGAVSGIRNPRAHDHRLMDEPRDALALLTLCDHLFTVLDASIRARARRPARP